MFDRSRLLPLAQTALIATLAGGLAEGVAVWMNAAGRPFGAQLATLIATAGVWALLAPLFFILAILGGSLGRVTLSQRILTLWSEPPKRAGLLAAAVLAGASLALLGDGTEALITTARPLIKDHTLIAQIGALIAVVLVCLGVALSWALFGPLQRGLMRLAAGTASRWRVVSLLTLALAFALAMFSVWPAASRLLIDIPKLPGVLFLGAFGAGLARLLIRRWTGLLATGLLLAVWASVAVGGLIHYSGSIATRSVMPLGHGLAPWMVQGLHLLTDGDDDGFSAWLGGGDCDDTDPSINPLATDIPGNGVDEDCADGDRRSVVPRPTSTVSHALLPEGLQKRWNILLVTIDAVRPDHLSTYGYARPTSPNLDRLAASALSFRRAYTPVNATSYAIPALFAGRHLADIDLSEPGRLVLHPGNEMIFERLRAAGYRTEARVPAQLKRGAWFGISPNFDDYQGLAAAKLKGRSVPALVKSTKRALLDMAFDERPWAMWVHLLEPHEPYLRHAKHSFGDSAIDRYDGEIAAADAGLGELLDVLEKSGQRENTIIIVTSDHGEEFGEHGRRFHGKQLYEESVLVPLVIHVPGFEGRWIETPVSLIDVAETIANLTGLEPGPDYGAVSLAGLLSGGEPPVRPIFLECRRPGNHRIIAMIDRGHKAIVDLKKGRRLLFDLEADPKEAAPLPLERDAKLLDALMEASRAQADRVLARARDRGVSAEIPAAFAASKPIDLGPGLTWIGTRFDRLKIGEQSVPRAHVYMKATGPNRANIAFKFEVKNKAGQVKRKALVRPLAGRYPSNRWAEGEVVETTYLLPLKKSLGKVKLWVTAVSGKKVLHGPVLLAEFDAGNKAKGPKSE